MYPHHSAGVAAVLQSADFRFRSELLEGLEEITPAAGLVGDMETLYPQDQGGPKGKTPLVVLVQ